MKKKILVIDDEELLTKTFSRLLEKENFDVMAALRPEDAIAMVEEENFDLVICDIRMPGTNGVETIRGIYQIYDQKKKEKPKIIFLTGFADTKIEKEAKALKPLAYIYKPFDINALLDIVKKSIG